MRNAFRNDRPEYREVLTELFSRTRALRDTPPPAPWQTWLRPEWDEQLEHGPRYSSGDWFGVSESEPHLQMRYRRAIQQLEKAKLLVVWRKFGRRLSHIKLTPAGLAAAVRLLDRPSVVEINDRELTSCVE